MVSTYMVAFWNVENLFDEEFSPHRSEKLKRAVGRDLTGWTPQLRDAKIAQITSALSAMSRGSGPDLLGVCEVENSVVMTLLTKALKERLPTRSYEFVHADTSDQPRQIGTQIFRGWAKLRSTSWRPSASWRLARS